MTKLKKNYQRKRHSVSLLHAHLVFCVKYRRRAITRRAFEILRRSMRKTAETIDIDLIAVQSDGDHLHLRICYPPTLSLSKIVHRLKGASSRHLRAQRRSGSRVYTSNSCLRTEALRRISNLR